MDHQYNIQRVSKKCQLKNNAEERIRKMLNLDIQDRINQLKEQYNKLNCDANNDLKKGYVMHHFPLRPCDIMRIHQNKRGIFDQQLQHSSRTAVITNNSKPIYSIAEKIVKTSKQPVLQYQSNPNASLLAELPAFYCKQSSLTRFKHKIDSTQLRIRSISNMEQGTRASSRAKTSLSRYR